MTSGSDRPKGIVATSEIADLLRDIKGLLDTSGIPGGIGKQRRRLFSPGRPPLDPAQKRTSRLGVRLHPDLREQLAAIAQQQGITLSMAVERMLIEAVNARHSAPLVDLFGRYLRKE